MISAPAQKTRLWKKVLLLFFGVACAVGGCELLLRVFWDLEPFVPGHHFDLDFAKNKFARDPELGFIPRFDTGLVDEHGTRIDRTRPSAAKLAGRKRILFLGDSATARGAIPWIFTTRTGTP